METDTEEGIRNCHWHATNAQYWRRNEKQFSVPTVYLLSLKENFDIYSQGLSVKKLIPEFLWS
jgi:hypothetical protein